MKRKHRVYTLEAFKIRLGIEGDLMFVELKEDGVHIHTVNEGGECVEGAAVLTEMINTYNLKTPRDEHN